MKGSFLTITFFVLTLGLSAQEIKFPPMDSSPADIVYYPLNVAKARDGSSPKIRVIYSRPTKKGREIFGVLEQFGSIWRIGANESTEIRFYQPVTIAGKEIEAGTYSLFALLNKDKWTMILNSQTDKWGAYTYDAAKDLLREEVKVKHLDKPLEALSITFNPQPEGTNLVIGWDSSYIELPISLK